MPSKKSLPATPAPARELPPDHARAVAEVERRNAQARPKAPPVATRAKSRRGFAVMDKDRQREIARAGGKAAHRNGNAHEFTSEEAREAGRKGGRAVSEDKAHMSEIGKKGGEERGKRHAAARAANKTGGAYT